MDYLKLLKNSYEQVKEFQCENELSKYDYLSDYIFVFNTYDSEISELFVQKALEVCIAITERKTFEYQKNKTNYQWYLIMCNMPFFVGKLEWGTSIRGAWWEFGVIFEIDTAGFYDGYEQIIEPFKFDRDQWLDFIKAMADFVTE